MWDIFTLVLSVFNVWMIPFEMSFGPMIDMYYVSLYLDSIIDVIFLVDTIVMFYTSFVTKEGKEIFDSKMIALNYMKTRRFYFDIAALLGTGPFESLWKWFKYF
jgi:hypothetical protein